MFKVLLRYIIRVCLFSAILLYLRTHFEEVRGSKERTSTRLLMKNVKSRKSEKEMRFQEDQRSKAEDDNCTTGNTKSESVMERLSTEAFNRRMFSNEDENWKTAKSTSCEENAHSKQHISFDLCLVFACHTASKKRSTEMAIFTTVAVFFWKASAFPLDHSSEEKRGTKRRRTVDTKQESKLRNASTKSHLQPTSIAEIRFSQGDCPAKWFQYKESKCYRFFPEKMNHKSAELHCSSLESRLVTLKTKEENFFVDQLTNRFHSVGYLWTGVKKLCGNCSGTGSFVNWYPGQPDHKSNCIVMVNAGQWKDFDCDYMFAFVCERAIAGSRESRQQLLALLIPMFSCITVAVIFTASLLVSSIRRGNQPFKISSRYGRTKRQRKIATWDMIENIRRASLKRRSIRHRPPQGSIPNIEITESDGAESRNLKEANDNKIKDSKFSKGRKTRNKKKSSNRKTFLEAPTDRRRSSGTISNSSLYELLVRLNKMDFEPAQDSTSIELQELRKETIDGIEEISTGNSELDGADREQLVERNELAVVEITERKLSFRNLAFRDSVVSVETSGSGTITITSLNLEKNIPRKNSSAVFQNTESNSLELKSHLPAVTSNARTWKSDNLLPSNNTKTVKVDVHKVSDTEDSAAGNGNNVERNYQKEPMCKRKRVWTYSI